MPAFPAPLASPLHRQKSISVESENKMMKEITQSLRKRIQLLSLGAMAAGTLTLTSCETRAQRGALYGGLGGAAIGAVAGDAEGALIGGAAGATAGAIIGSRRDRHWGPARYGYYDRRHYSRSRYRW